MKGKLEKCLIPKNVWKTAKDGSKWAYPIQVEYVEYVTKIIEETRKEFPLNPIIEAINLYGELKSHSEEEKQIVIDEHLKNCNLKRFILESVEWFEKLFGDGEDG